MIHTTAKVSKGTNRNLPARNTLVQLLALYIDLFAGGLRKHRHIEITQYTKHLESRLEVIQGHTFWDH